MTRETFFRKVGRKYVPVGEAERYDHVIMPDGYTLTYRRDGVTRWEYEVKPDSAGFVAAATVAREAMEAAIRQAATYRPTSQKKFTKRQLELIEQFKRDMGMSYPLWWQESSADDIVRAGIDAVRGVA